MWTRWSTKSSSISTFRPPESDCADRVAAAAGDERARRAGAAREVGLPALDDRDEAREREDARGRRAVRAETERVAHHRAHREAAEHRLLGREPGALPQF